MRYFDHSASTPPYEEVVRVVTELMANEYGNPSSLHRKGLEAEKLLKRAREVAALCLQTEPEHIVFTSGGTESNNLAIRGCAQQFSSRGKHLITSRIEHASVYECFQKLERDGFEVTYVPVDSTGSVCSEDVINAVRKDTILVSVMLVNNETGRIQPVEQIARQLSGNPRTLFHVDAIQGAGKLPLAPEKTGIDFLSISAHKFHGPKGAGILYRRPGLRLPPLMLGGGQEFGVRPGTENVPLIAGMAKALRISVDQQAENMANVYDLRRELIDRLADLDGVQITGSPEERQMSPYIVHLCLPGIKSEVFVHALEARGFYVSAKSACASGDDRPSRVLKTMGFEDELAKSGIRISLSPMHSIKDVRDLAQAIQLTIQQLKR